jgi:hypothetical protein
MAESSKESNREFNSDASISMSSIEESASSLMNMAPEFSKHISISRPDLSDLIAENHLL